MRRIVAPLALAAALALTAAACGDDANTAVANPVATTLAPSGGGVTVVDAAQAQQLLASQPDVVIVDVRTPAEYAEGHLDGALLIDIPSPDFTTKIDALDRDATYFVYCRSANRSAVATAMMLEMGFTNVYELGAGIRAWQAAGFPVTT
jgi:phage shock protein E